MSHSFRVEMPAGVKIADGVEMVRSQVEAAGGKYEFNGKGGFFAVHGVKGDFEVQGNFVIITILKKPILVTMGFVESKIREYFNA